MNNFKINRLLAVFLTVAVLSGCNTARKMSYLLDMEYNIPMDAPAAPELIIQRGDCLRITVTSEDPRLAAPFNAVLNLSDASSSPTALSYYVDSDGCISFPVIGSLYVQGKTIKQIQDIIANSITNLGYIKEPVVNVKLDYFTVTVIGKVSNSVLKVNTPSINLLQVVAQSGGTSGVTKIKEVTVIRTENGERTAYKVNLQKKDLFYSPVFYLQQNDIVYFKPKGTTFSSDGQMVMTFVGTGLSVISIIVNYLLWSSR